MSRKPVTITDRATDVSVEAVLDTDFPLVRLVDAGAAWSPYRLEAIRNFLMHGRVGPLPEHCHWNWAQKALPFETARHRVLAIEAAGQVQGLRWVGLRDHIARVPPDLDQPIVYVDYLEAAPWNTREYTSSPRFKGVGTRLLQAAITVSREAGFAGRVGLHSLPQSEVFYAGACGMQKVGIDAAYHDLTYFEYTAAAAVAFLDG